MLAQGAARRVVVLDLWRDADAGLLIGVSGEELHCVRRQLVRYRGEAALQEIQVGFVIVREEFAGYIAGLGLIIWSGA